MPKPKDGESEDDFVSRCIPMVMNEGSAEDNSQAAAMCHSMYSGKKRCEVCNGKGAIASNIRNNTGGYSTHIKSCTACNGIGLI